MIYLEIGWNGYGFMPYIKGIVGKIDINKVTFNNWFITIDRFKKEYENYSNWEEFGNIINEYKEIGE